MAQGVLPPCFLSSKINKYGTTRLQAKSEHPLIKAEIEESSSVTKVK
jgi:hypothetical protein